MIQSLDAVSTRRSPDRVGMPGQFASNYKTFGGLDFPL
jgi:hypothetical protein